MAEGKKKFRIGPAVVNIANMAAPMAEAIVNIAAEALAADMNEQAMAGTVRAKVSEAFPGNHWQVFVGRKFASWVTHKQSYYLYFYIDQMGFCVFST